MVGDTGERVVVDLALDVQTRAYAAALSVVEESVTRLRSVAAAVTISLPVDPVNATSSIPGWAGPGGGG
jgi:hypothetical protein